MLLKHNVKGLSHKAKCESQRIFSRASEKKLLRVWHKTQDLYKSLCTHTDITSNLLSNVLSRDVIL